MKRLNRYIRNGVIINKGDQEKLKKSKVCVLGCGGLGGYIIEMLARAGIGSLKVVDGDVFDETNLNRQLLSLEDNMGQLKAFIAKERVFNINSEIKVEAIADFINESNVKEIIEDYDLIFDALDDIAIRKMVTNYCAEVNIPYIYGAIAGWYGQVSTVMPNSHMLDLLYRDNKKKGKEVQLGNPSFTPALIASIQVSEGIKLLLGKGELLNKGFLHIDLLNNEIEKISIS